MAEAVPLPPDVEERLAHLGTADIVVGIPSFNNVRTIGHVVRAVAAGCSKYFPSARSVVVNSDGGSTDGTQEAVSHSDFMSPEAILIAHEVTPVQKIITPYHGIPGKGSALRTIFAIASRLRAKACAVVDSDLRSIAPGWIELLLGPVLERGMDYVSPLYVRHKHDGTITNSIVYPLTRALYGKEVRQPIGGDFGFSGALADHYLEQPVWQTNVARFGIDIWMTTTAIANGFKVCQAFLGAKIHDPKDPGADLSQMLVQVVSSVFDLMDTYKERWEVVTRAEEVPLFGFPFGVALEPVGVDVGRMTGIFRQGTRDLREIWEKTLCPDVLKEIVGLAESNDGFHFPDSLWVRVIYEFAIAHHYRVLPTEQLLGSLVPLYLGRTGSYVLETERSNGQDVEAGIQGLAEEFVKGKKYLVERWNRK